MNLDIARAVLAWSALINYLVLVTWFLVFIYAHDWFYNLHARWFVISSDYFDRVHYAAMAFYKLGIFLVLLGPYLALRIVS